MSTASTPSTTTIIQQCLDDLNAGKPNSLDRLFQACQLRLERMVKGMMNKYRRLRRWVDEEDVLNEVSLKLINALQSIKVTSTRDYLGLAAKKIRWQLIDLIRKYQHHFEQETPGIDSNNGRPNIHQSIANHPDPGEGPWEELELHELVEKLPDELREIFELHYYHAMTHEEIANHLNISDSTSKHRFLEAKYLLGKRLKPWQLQKS